MLLSRVLTLALLFALLAPVILLARPVTAQEAADVLTADIYAGECADTVDEPAATLVQPSLSEGEAVGAPDARPVATSFSTVPLSLEALLAEEHVVAVAGEQETAACGAIGGLRTETGAIVIELSEQGNSGLSGVAYLAPSGAGPGQTDISLFLAGLATAPQTPAEPTAVPTTEATGETSQDASVETTTEPGAVSTEARVTITDFPRRFVPDPVVVPVGGMITWVNRDLIPHSLASDDGVTLMSDELSPMSGTYSQTFTEPGTYPYYDVANPAIRGTIIVVEPTAQSTAETTGEASQDEPGATETYVSPTFGYSLTYDPSQWTVVEGPTSEDGLDFIGLKSGFTTVDIGATAGVPDAHLCVQFMTDNQTSQPDVTAFEPLLDATGAPVAEGDLSDAFAATRITRLRDDGTSGDQAFYVRCAVLPSGNAVLIIGQFVAAELYDTAAAQREELLEGLIIP